MEFRTPHLLLHQGKGPGKARGNLGAGAGGGSMTLMPQLLPHHLEMLHRSAPGLDVTKAGVRRAGAVGMAAVIVAQEKSITIIVGGMLLAHRHISHVHHRHGTLLLKLCQSHQHYWWQRLVSGGLPLVVGGLKGNAQ